MKNDWSPASAHLIETRPSCWEYRLFSQCLVEFIELQLSQPGHEPSMSELAGSKFTFHVASLESGQQFIMQIVREIEDLTEHLAAAIKLSPDDTPAYFGSPGQPGDPRRIAELAQRIAIGLQRCRQRATEIQSLRVVCNEAPLQVVADLFLRSIQHYTGHEYTRFEKFVRNFGTKIIEELDSGKEKINLTHEMSTFQPAVQPLYYELRKKLRLW